MNVGLTVVAPDNVAPLPAGAVKDQLKVNVSPSSSVEPLPSRVTVSPTLTV
jgi:hypothetical protein